MANPLVVTAGTTTLNLSHAIKVSKITVIAQSANAVNLTLSDLNGNVVGTPILVPASANAEVTADYTAPLIIPGGTNLTLTNCIATLTGVGGLGYIYHR